MRLAAIGDNCVDFYEKQGWAYPGGNAVNVAVYGRQLGMDAAYLGWIGTDNFGDMMQEKLKEQDVETVRMQRKQGKTAIWNRCWINTIHEIRFATELSCIFRDACYRFVIFLYRRNWHLILR